MNFWWWMAQHTVTTALLLLVVMLICRLIPRRPALQHALWLVVLVKFLVPPAIAWPWSVADARAVLPASWMATAAEAEPPEVSLAAVSDSPSALVVPAESVAKIPAEAPTAPPVEVPAVVAQIGVTEAFEAAAPSAKVAAVAPPAVIESPGSWLDWERLERTALGVWLLGSLVVALRMGRQIANYHRRVCQARPASGELVAAGRELARALGIAPLPILVTPGFASPLVWCCGSLRILWPERLAETGELGAWRSVLAHELAHVRRRDHWVCWLEMLAGIVWWWNPLFWLTRRRLRDAAEMACDALALSLLPDARRGYAEALLQLTVSPRDRQPLPALGASSRSRKTFARRLSMILADRVAARVSWSGRLAVLALAALAIPAWSLSQAGPAEQPATSPSSEATEPSVPAEPSVRLLEPPAGATAPEPVEEPSVVEEPTPLEEPTATEEAAPVEEPTPVAESLPVAVVVAKLRIPVGDTKAVGLRHGSIVRVVVEDPLIAGVEFSPRELKIEGKRPGSTKLFLTDQADNVSVIRLEVQAVDVWADEAQGPKFNPAVTAPPAQPKRKRPAAKATEGQPTLAPVAEERPPGFAQPTQRPTEAAPTLKPTEAEPPRSATYESARQELFTSGSSGTADRVDVVQLCIDIIDARGAVQLAEVQLANSREANARAAGTVSRGDLQTAEVKLGTAKLKHETLMRVARAEYESAQSDLQQQQAAAKRIESLVAIRAIRAEQVEQLKRRLEAAQHRVELFQVAIPELAKAKEAEAPAESRSDAGDLEHYIGRRH